MHFCILSVAWQKQEGDITYLTDKFLWPEDPDDPFFELPAESRSKRAAVKNRYRLWPNGIVPYVMSSSYSGIKITMHASSNGHSIVCAESSINNEQKKQCMLV